MKTRKQEVKDDANKTDSRLQVMKLGVGTKFCGDLGNEKPMRIKSI
eukprot:CAMPEP_0183706386 /NCGR_PEP_ID=MMETSP0737-20130205/3244_1 /TAXON_ID=385413 /ORGANISM="Thalassiosira miniscula, Strain CCMP1093" /LENGTH=45 /DNA_ID= /DNA_START= /DNA_END= /DNA_ORIENTATION=